MGDTDSKVCTFYIIVIILFNHYLLRGGYLTDSSLSHERIYGYYWSSTHRNTGAVGASYTLYFRSGYVDISIDDIGGGYHYNGFSVRCVAAG